MSPPVLRGYQERLFVKLRASLRTHRRSILQAPTGSGKSVLIAYMIARAVERGRSAWLTCHRKELLKQLSGSLDAAGVPHGVIQAGRSETKDPVQVCSIQTLVRRLDRLPPPDLLAIDEAHHASAATWTRVADHAKDSWLVGLTATPERTDGKGLDHIFNDIVLGPSVEWLTERGYLAPYRLYAPATAIDLTGIHSRGGDYVTSELEQAVDHASIVGDAVDHYRRLVAPGNCLVYCVTRLHARHVTAAYRAAGIDARYCAGDTPRAERDAIVAGLAYCRPPVVVSVDLFGEGLDVPGLRAVQMLRPTQSLTLYLQQLGRALRPEPGKDHAIILDHARNSMRHGLPEDERDWSLEGRKGRSQAGESAPGLRHCPECFCIFKALLAACPLCGWVPVADPRELPDQAEGELVKVDKAALAAERERKRAEERLVARRDGLEGLVRLAVAREYRFGWAARRWHYRKKIPLSDCFRTERRVRSELKKART